jgi:hypothetical protein
MTAYAEAVARGRARHGDKYREPSGAATFGPYLRGPRVRVRYPDGETQTGYIGLSTGWWPTFLLMLTSRSISSAYTLDERHTIEAVKHGRKYEAIR